ncbi:virulence factor Mce family protein [Mycobacterium sp. CVI_P3]|uniref:Virulence factor Mce family protein n=1 Tax=Mycobacterium pinniadriaticum TaxID=2994102 RepID=A0ABT3SF53_9MYCO|nr:virulence factor Mce family protein [Mycobacterium pinniadriaticum]MCX2931784.1 virulence factor Mce family protein [Mycobacterium pinniadriaticum]MCX2938141.1 virulence factor Mce family protein [Mycobacterium pinniadriaticum]
MTRRLRPITVASMLLVALVLAGCSNWRGANSLPLPGTQGRGPGAYTIQAQLPDVDNIERNSRVRVGDVTVGNVTKIERQGWHAQLTMTINGGVELPANATATIGQTSLLGSKHVELAAPTDVPPEGKLHDGSLIPLRSGGSYPNTEQTLAAVSLLLNGGGLGQIQDITQALSTAFGGREDDLRSLIQQLDTFMASLNDQSDDILAAIDGLNNLAGQFAAEKPVVEKALKNIPDALSVLKDQRDNLAGALDQFGKFSALTADAINQSKDNLVKELKDLGPVLQSLADAGPALTRSLGFYSTFPFPKDTLSKWMRGDYANLTAVFDFTLSRLDSSYFTGTRWEGNLTELEMQWGRTIGQLPSPYTRDNPLVAPYNFDQGP